MGVNKAYGTPQNPAAPDHVPGGSSSGSAVAVAGGFVDFALGNIALECRIFSVLSGVVGRSI